MLIGPLSFPLQSDSLEMSDPEEVPTKFLEKLLNFTPHQSASLSSFFTNLGVSSSNESSVPPAKRQKTQGGATAPHPSPNPSRVNDYDPDDDFDARFGHLIGSNVNNDDPAQSDHSEPLDNPLDDTLEQAGLDSVMSDGEESVDEALVEITDKIPNWDPYSQLKKFISKTIDRQLPEQMLNHLNDEFVPPSEMQKFFIPPIMPKRLYITISKMKSKSAIKTEKAMYNAQKELLVTVKPLLISLTELKPLGEPVKLAREKLSISIQGLFSTSLKISYARRENVRFLFKNSLADVLYGYEPNHHSLFGGSSFASQIEIAAKEAKLDLSWAKAPPKPKQFMPFRTYNQSQQGFQFSRGYKKSSDRRHYSANQNPQKKNYINKKFNKSSKSSPYQGKQ